MHRTTFIFIIILALGIAVLNGFSQSKGAEKSHEVEKKEEYKSTAKQTKVLQDELAVIKGKEANIIALEFPPG